MSTIVPICVPLVYAPQVDVAVGETFGQNDAPQLSESSNELSSQDDETSAETEEDSGEHSPAGTDPDADPPRTPRGPRALCSALAQPSPACTNGHKCTDRL